MSYKIIFIDEELENTFEKLDNTDPIKKALINAIKSLKQDPFVGRNVKKKLSPKKLIDRYGLNNLRIYNLPNAWRMLYTLTSSGDIELIAVVLDWMNHKDYERLFKF